MIQVDDIKAMTVQQIVKDIGPMMIDMTPLAWKEALIKVWLEGKEQDAKEFLSNSFEYMKARCDESPNNEIEIFGGGDNADEVVKMTNEAAEHVARIWKAKNEENKQRREVMKHAQSRPRDTDTDLGKGAGKEVSP